MTLYAYTGKHPSTLHGGAPIASGETVELSAAEAKEKSNQRLIDAGWLTAQSAAKSKAKKSGQTNGGDES